MAGLRMSLRVRLLSGFLGVAAIGLAGNGIGLAGLLSTGAIASGQYQRVTLPAASLMKVSSAFQRMATGIRDVIIADNDSDLGRAASYLDAQKGDMESAMAEYLGGAITANDKTHFTDFQAKLGIYTRSIDSLAAKVQEGDKTGAGTTLKVLRGQAVGLQTIIDGLNDGIGTMAASGAKIAASRVGGATASFLAFAVASLALSIAFGLFMSRSISAPIRAMVALAGAIAEGDLTGELDRKVLERGDEVGGLASAIASMKEGILGNIGQIKTVTASLGAMGEALGRNAVAASGAAAEIASSVSSVKEKVQDQGSGVTETSATIEQILKSIGGLDAQIEDQVESVGRSSAAVEQMVANIRAVTGNVELLGASFTELSSASEAGKGMIEDMSSRISSIASQSEKLDEANGVVSNIATQTNLLAMNAAIEAAHAGQFGKGFAVVADEIRKLAEIAAEQSKEISADIGGIKQTIQSMVPSSEETSRSFAEILRLIGALGSMEAEIKRAMREQSEGSREVLEAIERINSVTASVRRGSAEIREGSSAIAVEMRDLLEGSVALGSAMERIERVAAGVEGVSEDMRSISGEASGQVRALVERLDCYTIPEACVER